MKHSELRALRERIRAPAPEQIATRRTADNYPVHLYDNGDVSHAGGTFTRHRLPIAAAWEVMEAVSMFDRAEMPSLVGAAAKLARAGKTLDFWATVRLANEMSEKAGTRPADVNAPTRTARVAVWTPEELRARAAGYVVAPRGTVAMKVPIAKERRR